MSGTRCLFSALLIAIVFATVACTSSTPEKPSPAPTATEPAAVEIPDTPAGQAGTWVLETLAADSGPTASEAEERFSETFLQQVPADQVATVFDSLRAAGDVTLESWDDAANTATAVLSTSQGKLKMSISVDDAGEIDGLIFAPEEEAPEVADPAEASVALAERAEHSSFLLADEQCNVIEARDADTPLPMGSMFKLYVLGAVVTKVEVGDLAWDDELTLAEEHKSLPSGTLQNEPAGTTITVRETAELMISISDNTATDLLIDTVGREAVEDELATMGHHAPQMNIPLLTTREMFQIASSDQALRDAWGDITPTATDTSAEVSAAQRAFLDELPVWDLAVNTDLFAQPFWPEGLDWFATAEDICAAHRNLHERASTPAGEPVPDILGKNPGVAVPDVTSVAFKGGSSIGEIGLSFRVERPAGTRILVMQTASTNLEQVPTDAWVAGLAEQVLGMP